MASAITSPHLNSGGFGRTLRGAGELLDWPGNCVYSYGLRQPPGGDISDLLVFSFGTQVESRLKFSVITNRQAIEKQKNAAPGTAAGAPRANMAVAKVCALPCVRNSLCVCATINLSVRVCARV